MPFKKNSQGVMVDDQGYDPSGNRVPVTATDQANSQLSTAFSSATDKESAKKRLAERIQADSSSKAGN